MRFHTIVPLRKRMPRAREIARTHPMRRIISRTSAHILTLCARVHACILTQSVLASITSLTYRYIAFYSPRTRSNPLQPALIYFSFSGSRSFCLKKR